MLATQKKRTQPVEQPPSASQAPISASNLPSGGSGGSTLRLRAVVLGAPRNSFCIEASPDDDINALQEKVKSVKPQRLGHLDPYELNLWKLKSPILSKEAAAATFLGPNTLESALELYAERLDGAEIVSDHFALPLAAKSVHFVVQLPVEPSRGRKRRASEPPEPDSPSKRLKADHEAGLRIAQDKPAPSTAADAMNLLHTQQKDPIFITRPHSTRGPPITIYHSAFADFRRNLKTGRDLEIPPEYYKIVSAFLVTSCALYASERERRNALLPFLKELCGQTITPGQFDDGYSSNGISATKVSLESMGTMALLLLLELKNEIGTGRCDPSTQASFSFTRWWATNDFQPEWFENRGLCASFLLSIAGPWVSVHGGVLLGKDWVIQPLTDFVWTGTGPDIELDNQVARVAQLFYSLRIALGILETEYVALPSAPRLAPPCFPYIAFYGNDRKITYKERLHCSDQKATAIFAAEDPEGKRLFIKFTSRYNEQAHRLLHEKGYAPALHHCSETVAGSGCFMVVMDWVDGEYMFGKLFTEDDLRRVREAKDLLHEKQLVFGDLRPNNIIKPADGSGVMLVDFDWCASAGQGRYPLTINSDPSCGWHPGVGPGVIMLKEHDDHLYARLSSNTE